METGKNHEIRLEGGYKEQLAQAFEHLFPQESRERSLEEQRALQEASEKREIAVMDRDLLEVALEYRADLTGLQSENACYRVIERGWQSNDEEYEERRVEEYDEVFSLPVRNHFSEERLPHGYGYKGGAARALLLRTLGIDSTYQPRDIDIVRLTWENPDDTQDAEVAQHWMSEATENASKIEVISDRDDYFTKRDLRMNEILATDDYIQCTKSALLDIMRHVIRPTKYELSRWHENLGPKMLAKILRFYAEAIHRYDEAYMGNLEDWRFEEAFITPFWLALQLDKACEISSDVAWRYVEELIARRQLPKYMSTIEEAAKYLIEFTYNFSYRHAPTEQFVMEDHWAQIDEDRKKSRRGSVRGMREDLEGDDDADSRDKQRKAQRQIKQKAKETAIDKAEI
ncbi:MAG: hypothetical protein ACD_50C00006G0001 [uncultured bacterium]|uniref:Uncharacterized protein n=1 Tax=Candidatus Uhrbacteria bacterium GW2011_GWC1_41_20 TaxID=1618983 RepID=A0A0G0VDC6_9BACT|nr:MAG: hypothetical protein ACD_50C00006G0001 [uncultured bacterium]KKR22952.1 MAG: hypothetical protein UT52_C0004G0001 [Candidatus Uhrbacteria bacterium GW2011_GWE1_39_46]KKR63803.1 MAG: hypothetical protein UU04_C0012G0041 [Candidatus Uhrbacteria bacterium GW2011_GWC2_40_450]KKR89893.1 MAG: hypothetical protein UU40_C0012G0001 [Candidatus Uhrbacteria bacterium GW2011_GWD2_41_121]KKR95763.1 MAG: hypothetical protein UU46_C0014G0001 [Candidatus Uhrbacteria bacterium GW2011_GWD1_41_16]KKR9889